MNLLKFLFPLARKDEKGKQVPVPAVEESLNRSVLGLCRAAGVKEVRIRRALIELNGVNVVKAANGVAASTLYGTIKGKVDNPAAQAVLSEALGLRVEELFLPEQQ